MQNKIEWFKYHLNYDSKLFRNIYELCLSEK